MNATTEKIFIGGCKAGNFHNPQNGEIDVIQYLSQDDINLLVKRMKNNDDGVFTNNDGKKVIKLRIKTNRSGEKIYGEVDTWKPSTNGQPQAQAVPAEEVADSDDDLPF